jgi:hypothetical protein
VLDPLGELGLCHSEHGSISSKGGSGSGEEPIRKEEMNPFERVVKWLEERGVHAGHPENIVHSFSCQQRGSLKSEELIKSRSLTSSVILLRRSKISMKEENNTLSREL